MKLFNSRPFLIVILGIGFAGLFCLLSLTALCVADHRSFPWTLWVGGAQWAWGTWLADQRLFQRMQPQPRLTPTLQKEIRCGPPTNNHERVNPNDSARWRPTGAGIARLRQQ